MSDLAHWLDRPYATVRTWVIARRVPHTIYQAQIALHLELLEKAIASRTVFPLPAMSAHKRPEYIKQVRDAARRRFFKADIT